MYESNFKYRKYLLKLKSYYWMKKIDDVSHWAFHLQKKRKLGFCILIQSVYS